MGENVKIPLSLLNRTIEVMEYIDVSEYHPPFTMMFDDVLSSLRKKKRSLDLRRYYADILCADGDNERFNARMKYLLERRRIQGE
jgi:hypothetical protein